jgi:hypothetical protein
MTSESDNQNTVNAERYVTAEQRQLQTNGHSNHEGYPDISEKQCNGRTAFLKHNDWIMMRKHQMAAATETNRLTISNTTDQPQHRLASQRVSY